MCQILFQVAGETALDKTEPLPSEGKADRVQIMPALSEVDSKGGTSLGENSAGSEEGAHSDMVVEGAGEAGLAAEGWKGRVTPTPPRPTPPPQPQTRSRRRWVHKT